MIPNGFDWHEAGTIVIFATLEDLERYGPVVLREYLARQVRNTGGQVVEFTREGQ